MVFLILVVKRAISVFLRGAFERTPLAFSFGRGGVFYSDSHTLGPLVGRNIRWLAE